MAESAGGAATAGTCVRQAVQPCEVSSVWALARPRCAATRSPLVGSGWRPKEVATAKYWAAEGGSRIGHAALHIHGGISIDVDYPVHRYFLWLKTIENTLGAATPQLVRLGERIAAEG